MCLIEGQVNDHIGAKLVYPTLPESASCLIGDKGYDSDEFRSAFECQRDSPLHPAPQGPQLSSKLQSKALQTTTQN